MPALRPLQAVGPTASAAPRTIARRPEGAGVWGRSRTHRERRPGTVEMGERFWPMVLSEGGPGGGALAADALIIVRRAPRGQTPSIICRRSLLSPRVTSMRSADHLRQG